ncbi:MAG: PspA/IM30 family protein [Nostocales cyanobacterium]|nr:MAG: PspA/IM30 family protein [Nostocales cyanobacterium]TAF12611.1 MAG: PspA/IM30 family protein [Nostocales cyanobacterium]
MELFKRAVRVIRANVNHFVNGSEDPEKVLEQTVAEMQLNLMQMRQGIACAIATQKRTERQALAANSQAEEWYRRAQIALQQNNETLAREALSKRQSYQKTSQSLFEQIEQQKQIVDRLKQDMRSLELKISEVKTKKDMYIARARSAQASYKLQEMLSDVSSTSTLSALERMEDKVIQMESQAEVITQLGGDNLEKRFDDLKSINSVDSELTAMKTQMLNDAKNHTTPGNHF